MSINQPLYACSDTQRDTKFIAHRKMQDTSSGFFRSERIQVKQRGIPALTVYQWYSSGILQGLLGMSYNPLIWGLIYGFPIGVRWDRGTSNSPLINWRAEKELYLSVSLDVLVVLKMLNMKKHSKQIDVNWGGKTTLHHFSVPSLKLTVRPWKWMVGIRTIVSFWGKRPIFTGFLLLVWGSVYQDACLASKGIHRECWVFPSDPPGGKAQCSHWTKPYSHGTRWC